MPIFATLDGSIVIRVNSREHLPHHVHVEWRDEEALLCIADGAIYAGSLTGHILATALTFIAANRAALTEAFFTQNPNLPRPRGLP